MTLLESINTDGISNTLGGLSQIKQVMIGKELFNWWAGKGQPEITDPAQYNYLLEYAIQVRNKSAILDIYEKGKCIDWDLEDSLADEYDLLVDMANDVIYS